MQSASTPVPYAEFGELLTQLRVAAGFIKQQELATALGVTQQSVSRWEKGLARPRSSAIPALEQLVRAKDNELLMAAGYQTTSANIRAETATSHDRPLPLSALPPETFESFCAAFLHRVYHPLGGTVHRYGGTGHKQYGIDIFASGPFGTHSFQCKRVNEFGAQKVHAAVAAQTYVANLKILLLSSVASTNSRDAMAAHSGWELWDREDITRRFHDLPLMDRLDLVDRYFSGQRFDLLGVDEPGPIQSPEDFFKPLLVSDRFFNHSWTLVGRDEEVSQVVDCVQDESVVLTCLVGTPGAGKSRVLREVTQRLIQSTTLHVRFVSPTEEVKAHHLDRLRDSRGCVTLLIVDDAHERDDLGILLRYSAVPENRTRLLLSLRPYGKEALRLQAADVSLSGPSVRFADMQPQTREQAQALAESVLTECKAPPAAAVEIARATYTTPLVTVLAAQLVARDGVSLALLGNAEEFSTYVLKSLQDVITVALVTGQDVPKLRAILRVIALLQPIIPDDPNLLNILLKTEGIEQPDAGRLIRLLGEAGVLFKRGLRSRLAPDLLADEIIRSNYLNTDGTANERVTQVFDLAGTTHLKSMFVNLGRLDWRLREGKTDDSALLTSLSPKLHWGERYSNPHVEAVEAVAYYQPRFALNFAKRLIAEGHGDNSSVCNMVRYAAYTYNHLPEACQLLWTAGRNDTRALNQQPGHGIRILKELAQFQVNKSIEYVREVVRFALALLERPASLTSTHTPFAILEGTLNTEMESTSYSGLTLTITRYQLPLERVLSVRDEVTGALLKYLREGPPHRAFLAARTMAYALRGPMHSDTVDLAWQREHVKLLQELKVVLNEVHVSPVVLVRLAQSISWHAFYGRPETSGEAQAIFDLLSRDLRTRLIRALVDGWGSETWKLSETLEREEHVEDRKLLTADLITEFPEPRHLFDELHAALDEIVTTAHDGYGSPFLLINHLLASVQGLATELLLRCNEGRGGHLDQYVGAALGVVVAAGDSNFVDEYISRSEEDAKVLAQLAEAYMRFESSRPYTPPEVELFKRIFQSKDPTVLMVASNLVRQVASRSPALAVELICLADFEVNIHATHDMFLWLSNNNIIPKAEVEYKRNELLRKLVVLKKLDDHWVLEFLTASIKKTPAPVVALVMARLLEVQQRNDWSYKPLHKEHNGKGLGLMEAETGPRLLRDLLDWAREKTAETLDARYVGEAVSGLCGDYGQVLLDLLLDWLSSGTQAHANLVAAVLRESQPTLIYDHSKFIRDILDAAELVGQDALDEIRSAIAMATYSGVRGGAPGEPFPEDIRMQQHCEQMLASLSRAEPAFDLYDGLLKDACYAIARQRKSREALEEDDD
ncbi:MULTISPECIES: helix-turn-helix domain-containing protein [Chromobacterium]|uniref:helix-turn-helix domain-containing protein n=1 Tax=Chromobacterium TaxID=535 RepID=UPI001888B062|nr:MULTISPECIES: helix-turn-helix domain-containing protein [Chromobacterium]QOZ83025.1 helix-turn-helix domain-containing protein [Chromobacterium sp. Rain0013]WON83107.1 helix-turn-helix domain-containing protein [Chromobacterium haemolyticum]